MWGQRAWRMGEISDGKAERSSCAMHDSRSDFRNDLLKVLLRIRSFQGD